MKKYVLVSSLFLALGYSATAQTRLSLYEEFTGENCPPCASTNPGLWALINTPANNSKVVIIKYQVPIPSAGPIYNLYKPDADNRTQYYGVRSAPHGNMDGGFPQGLTSNHPGYLNQGHINAASSVASNFNITTSHSWYANGDSIRININVTALNAHTGTNIKLRAALIESLYYDAPPGTNGETEFHNVVRRMFPAAGGTQSLNTWAANQTQTYVLEGAVPKYIDKQSDVNIIVWLQDDQNKKVLQASKSSYANVDVDLEAVSALTKNIACENDQYDYKIELKNRGLQPITSAEIKYYVNGNASTYNFSGNIAPNASTVVTLGTVTLSNGFNSLVDTIVSVNGDVDMNVANNYLSEKLQFNSVATNTLPIAFNFNSTTLPQGWNILNSNLGNKLSTSNDWRILRYTNTSTIEGTGSSTGNYATLFNYPTAGNMSYIILPYSELSAGPKAIEFDLAYTNRGDIKDGLEVVYSSDCGNTWNVLWSKKGMDIASAPAVAEDKVFAPSETSHWRSFSIDASAITGKNLIAIRNVSSGGNHMFLDNINLRNGAPTSTNNISYINELNLFPNPTKGNITLSINTQLATNATITVTNVLGQQVIANKATDLKLGQNDITVDVTALNAGVYMMNITTDAGTMTKKFTKN